MVLEFIDECSEFVTKVMFEHCSSDALQRMSVKKQLLKFNFSVNADSFSTLSAHGNLQQEVASLHLSPLKAALLKKSSFTTFFYIN